MLKEETRQNNLQRDFDFFSALSIGIFGEQKTNETKAFLMIYFLSERLQSYMLLSPKQFSKIKELIFPENPIVNSFIFIACAYALRKEIIIIDIEHGSKEHFFPNRNPIDCIQIIKHGDRQYEFIESNPSPQKLNETSRKLSSDISIKDLNFKTFRSFKKYQNILIDEECYIGHFQVPRSKHTDAYKYLKYGTLPEYAKEEADKENWTNIFRKNYEISETQIVSYSRSKLLFITKSKEKLIVPLMNEKRRLMEMAHISDGEHLIKEESEKRIASFGIYLPVAVQEFSIFLKSCPVCNPSASHHKNHQNEPELNLNTAIQEIPNIINAAPNIKSFNISLTKNPSILTWGSFFFEKEDRNWELGKLNLGSLEIGCKVAILTCSLKANARGTYYSKDMKNLLIMVENEIPCLGVVKKVLARTSHVEILQGNSLLKERVEYVIRNDSLKVISEQYFGEALINTS